MKLFLRILLLVSFIFIFLYLYKNNLLKLPELQKPGMFFFSIFLILVGYLFDSYGWKTIIKTKTDNILFQDALISNGKYILSKYIPGKIWSAAGRAGYIKDVYNESFVDLTSLSLFSQILGVLSGALVGVGIVFFINLLWFWIIVLVILFLFLSIYFAYKPCLKIASNIISSLLKKEIYLTYVPVTAVANLIVIFILNWAVWSAAFYFFLTSVSNNNISISSGLLFPISSVLAVLVIFAPGGIGFREGFMSIGLISFEIPAQDAASIAILSRVWFLAGEFSMFILAVGIQFKIKNQVRG